MLKEISIGVVGAGNIAKYNHLPAYKKVKGVRVAAICDIDIEKAKRLAEEFGIEKYYGSMDEMIKCEDIDAVDICTWNREHVPLSLKAVRLGKHVMCEKPAAVSLEELKQLKIELEKTGLVYLLAVPNRFKSETIYLKSLADRNFFGDICYAKANYLRRRGAPVGWFSDKSISGGGPIMDIGVHAIDSAWYLLGSPRPIRVCASLSYAIGKTDVYGKEPYIAAPSPNGKYDCEDTGAGVIDFENGTQLFFEASWTLNLPDRRETFIGGSKAGAMLTPPTLYTDLDGVAVTENLDIDTVDPFAGEIEHFCECVRSSNTNTRYNIDQAIVMQTILQAIYRSDELKRQVEIDKDGNIL